MKFQNGSWSRIRIKLDLYLRTVRKNKSSFPCLYKVRWEKVWWMTPGWIKFRHNVFKGCDKGLANENFPRHTGGAVVLDGIGYVDQYMNEYPEEFLEYSDWVGIPIQGYQVILDRFNSLLLEQVEELYSR